MGSGLPKKKMIRVYGGEAGKSKPGKKKKGAFSKTMKGWRQVNGFRVGKTEK